MNTEKLPAPLNLSIQEISGQKKFPSFSAALIFKILRVKIEILN